ncbi:MAG: hypothetical protein U1E27_09435 [Kiritimatiellia bacterium]|nr:hypothetical protein [Kiritimatiellia bacterium]
MHEGSMERREVTRITCVVHQQLDDLVAERLRTLGAQTVLLESARVVRLHERPRRWGLPGSGMVLNAAPAEIFRTTVPRAAALRVLHELIEVADLRSAGRGAVYAQDIVEIGRCPPPDIDPGPDSPADVLQDLTLIGCILSKPGSGDELARTTLLLGVGVPVISLGDGTGIRDRMGLLRITVPPEREMLHLMAPSHDAASLQRLLVEEGRMARPGGGFLYQTPIRAGMVDPMVRIGPQAHAASMEQMIAALDDLKKGTAWRKRFDGIEPTRRSAERPLYDYRELTFICSEGRAAERVQTAIRAGASGATTSLLRCLQWDDLEEGTAARERGVMCVPASREPAVRNALLQEAEKDADPAFRLQILSAPSVYSHMRNPPPDFPQPGASA